MELLKTLFFLVDLDSTSDMFVVENFEENLILTCTILFLFALFSTLIYYLVINGILKLVMNSPLAYSVFIVTTGVIGTLIAWYITSNWIYEGADLGAIGKNFIIQLVIYTLLLTFLFSFGIKRFSLNANRTPF